MKEETYRRPAAGQHPPNLSPEYKSTTGRSPRKPAIVLPQTLSEITGPLLQAERLDALENDLTRQRMAEPLGERIIVQGRVLDEDGRPVPKRPGRDLAVQRRRPLPPSRRPARRAARSQLLRRRPRARRCRGPLPVHHHQARRLSVEEPPQCVAAGAHPFLAVRAGLRHAPDHPDVFPRRSAAGLRPDLQLGARQARASACRRPSTWI